MKCQEFYVEACHGLVSDPKPLNWPPCEGSLGRGQEHKHGAPLGGWPASGLHNKGGSRGKEEMQVPQYMLVVDVQVREKDRSGMKPRFLASLTTCWCCHLLQ